MDGTGVQALLVAVRRHLWRARFASAVRRAALAGAALWLLAALLHLAWHPLDLADALALPLLAGAAALAWAAARRPSDPECAWWADRQLGGASAFTTWLETRAGGGTAGSVESVRWLERWAAQRVPHCQQELARRRDAPALTRPLAALAVSGALALLVMALSPAPTAVVATAPRPADPAAGGGRDTPAAPIAMAPAPTALVDDVARALRPAADAAGPGAAGRTPAAGPARTTDGDSGRVSPAQAASGSPLPGAARAPDPADGSVTPSSGMPPAPGGQAGSGGREAGDGADTRADVGVSRALRATRRVPRSAAADLRPASALRRADVDQVAGYDDAAAAPGTAAAAAQAVAAATPPSATAGLRLTATETHYVQAWMKASARQR